MSPCSCPVDDYDAPDVFSETMPMACKPHTCCECRSAIKQGEKYVLVRGLWDGRWSTFKVCSGCADIRKNVAPCEPFGGLWEYFREWADDIGPGNLDGLSPAGLAKLDEKLVALEVRS